VHQPHRGRRGGKRPRKQLAARRRATNAAARAARPPRPQARIRQATPVTERSALSRRLAHAVDAALGGHLALVVVLFALGGAVFGAAAAAVTTAAAPADYTASADTRLIVEGEPGHPDAGVQSAFRQAEILADLAVAPAELDVIGRALDPPATGEELAGAVTSRRQPDQLIITFSARDDDPTRAAAIANAAAESFVAATSRNGEARIRTEVAGSAEVPQHPTHRYLPRNLAVGVVGGAVLGIAAALMVRQRRRAPEVFARRRVDRLATAIGALLGLAIVAGIALRLPDTVVQGTALLALGVAALAPGAGLAVLAMTLPMREPPGFTPVGYPALLIAATAYGVLLTIVASKVRLRIGALGFLAVGYLAIAAVSIVPAISGIDGDHLVDGIVRLVSVGMGFVLVAVSWSYFSRRDSRPHLVLAVLAAAIAGLVGILQYSANGSAGVPIGGLIFDPPAGGQISRVNGPFFNPNYFAIFLGLALVIALSLAATSGRMRILALACIPIGAALVLTFSRGALLATGVGIVVLVWSRSRVAGLVLAAFAMVAIIVLIPSILLVREGPSFVPPPSDLRDEISDTGRFEAMLSSFPIWRLDPVFGAGFGQYGAESAWFLRSSPATSSHNEYLSILAEQGLLGVAMFGALAGLVIARIGRGGRWSRELGLAPLVAYAAGWMIIEPLASLQTSGLIWLVVGAAGAAATVPLSAPAKLPQREAKEVPPPRSGIAARALAQ